MSFKWATADNSAHFFLSKNREVAVYFEHEGEMGVVFKKAYSFTNKDTIYKKKFNFDPKDLKIKVVNQIIQNFAKKNKIFLPLFTQKDIDFLAGWMR